MSDKVVSLKVSEFGNVVDELVVRHWFKRVDLDQARDTFLVVGGIL